MNRVFLTFFFVFVQSLTVSCQYTARNARVEYECLKEASNDSLELDWSKYKKCGSYVINDTIDLRWKTLYLPADTRIVMNKGLFKNGCIVGCNTILKYKKIVFDSVHVRGSWKVPQISTSMFKTLTYDNSLKDVLALASTEIFNHIHIEEGCYQVTATEFASNCLNVGSNTNLIIDGRIVLTPNGLAGYSIINITGKNIVISGRGSIIGDKPIHTGNEGEWGMGIYIVGGENIKIKDLTIKDCWGDCIYIRRNAKRIIIENCLLDNGRRQGISIISAQDVRVRNCLITNIGGTNPSYGIDVEPNQGDMVSGVKIENVEVANCRGGFECNGHAKNAVIKDISIKKCTISKTKSYPLRFIQADAISIEKCKIDGYKASSAIFFKQINVAYVAEICIDGEWAKGESDILSTITSDNIKQLKIK